MSENLRGVFFWLTLYAVLQENQPTVFVDNVSILGQIFVHFGKQHK